MRTTLKSINENLPRFDVIRRNYMLRETTGWIDGRSYIRAVYADIDPDTGNCIDITIYASGEALAARHYYAGRYPDTVFDITDQIVEVLTDANWNYKNSKAYRSHVVKAIQEVIEEGN